MGHAPPNKYPPSPGHLLELAERARSREALWERRKAAVAREAARGWPFLLGAGVTFLLWLWSAQAAAASMMLQGAAVAVALMICGPSTRQPDPERWFEREFLRRTDPGDPYDVLYGEDGRGGLELELDYRLGLKRRPDPELPSTEQVTGLASGLPPVPPPPPPPRGHSVDRDVRSAASALLTSLNGLPADLCAETARMMQGVRDQQGRGHRCLVLFESGPELMKTAPSDTCRCGHFHEVHSRFNRSLRVNESYRDKRKCVAWCSCEDYRAVSAVMLGSDGLPTPENPGVGFVDAVENMSLDGPQELGEYPPLPTRRNTE